MSIYEYSQSDANSEEMISLLIIVLEDIVTHDVLVLQPIREINAQTGDMVLHQI